MNNLFKIVTISLLSTGANGADITEYETEGNLAATNPLSCVAVTSVGNDSTAADVAAGAVDCAKKSNYSRAAQLVMIASAYAFYDTQRVSDKTAHVALSTVFTEAFSPIPETDMQNLFQQMATMTKETKEHQEVCQRLSSVGPPTYMPDYMIAHGMEAIAGSKKDPLVARFNPKKSWSKALGFANCSD